MIKNFFEKDSVLKIVSLFVALLVWLYVIYIEDPEIETTIDNIPVSYKAADLPGDIMLINYDIKTVDVKVSGNRSDVMELDSEDITAALDLSAVSEPGKHDNIKINVSTSNKKIEVVDSSDKKTAAEFDDVISKQFDIEAEFEGDMPDGYIVADKPSTDIQSIRVIGAKKYVENINGAYVKIDCSGLSHNKTMECIVYLKDKNGKIIDKKHDAYKYIEISDKNVSAYVTVRKTVSAKIEVKDGADMGVISVSPSEIEIYSSDQSVDKLYTKSIKNEKPDKDGNITVKLEIPDGVTVVNGETSVKVKVKND